VDVGSASFGVHNGDAQSGGLALHAGGRIVANALRVGAPAGSPLGSSIASGDDSLRALAGEPLFARHFGMGGAAWAAQPAARRVDCGGDCGTSIDAALAAGARLLVIDGDLALQGPRAVGSAEDPVALVVTGALHLSGDVAIHGVVHGRSLAWNDAAPGAAFIRGAAVVAGDMRGNAPADIVRDAAVLDRLINASGSFVRVNGSWKDF
jgi:hypothetical protein